MALPVEPKLYLEKAQEALRQSRDNITLGYYDVAISRAYYAMFYAATALLRSRGISPKKHSATHSAFAQYFVKPGLIEAKYSKMLGNAFNLRLDSDYEVVASFSKSLTDDVLQDAEDFVARAEMSLKDKGYL